MARRSGRAGIAVFEFDPLESCRIFHSFITTYLVIRTCCLQQQFLFLRSGPTLIFSLKGDDFGRGL